LDGPWTKVTSFMVQRSGNPQNFPLRGTFRYWKLATTTNWGSDSGITVNRIRMIGGSPIVCGDSVGIKSAANRRFFSASAGGQVLASAGSLGGGEAFTVYCGAGMDGAALTEGMKFALRSGKTRRWLVDGSSPSSDSDSPTIIEMDDDVTGLAAEPQASSYFTAFEPADLNARNPVERNAPVALRTPLTRNLVVLDGQTEVRSEQFGAKPVEPRGRFTFHIYREWVETGCADGSREAFTTITLFPNVAGCAAKWSKALGACPAGNVGTGNGLYGCSACASGWHVCGAGAGIAEATVAAVNPNADPEEVYRHISYESCKNAPGVFATAASAFSSSVAPPYQGSDHVCNTCDTAVQTLGCGTATNGVEGAGSDCSNFPELMGPTYASGGAHMPASCDKNKKCLGSGFTCNGVNDDLGKEGDWRGVMCCRDNTFSSLKK
jgi:hypothetical protein